MSRGRICVIIPTLNEEQTICDVIKGFPSECLNLVVDKVVIDGHSTDRTLELARAAGAKVLVQKGRGKGAAIREAAKLADAEILVFIDGDGTYSPHELERLVQPIVEGSADLAVGSRFKGKIEEGAISRLNRIGNRLFILMTNWSMRANLSDMLSGYRAIRADSFRELVLFSNGFEIEAEITIESLAKGLRTMEVPITYRRRRGSKAKLNPIDDGARIMKTLFFVALNARPLFFFGLFALIFFIIGAYPASLVLYEKLWFGEVLHLPSVVLSSVLFVSGALILIFGILADMIMTTRRRLEHLLRRSMQQAEQSSVD